MRMSGHPGDMLHGHNGKVTNNPHREMSEATFQRRGFLEEDTVHSSGSVPEAGLAKIPLGSPSHMKQKLRNKSYCNYDHQTMTWIMRIIHRDADHSYSLKLVNL